MAEPAPGTELFHGQPSVSIALPSGDALRVLLHGAHLASWQARGQEQFYLSPRSVFDGRSAIRGGVPICFPQFNQRGDLPKHGFARNLPWELAGPVERADEQAQLTLRLQDDASTRVFWPQAFEARLILLLAPSALQLTLEVKNRGQAPLSFTGALHSYFGVEDIAQARLHGLQGQAEWDAVHDRHGVCAQALCFDGEFDRVYQAARQPLLLEQPHQTLVIEQSETWAETVVWNPGADKCAGLADMPPDGYQRMLCVEAAQVFSPIVLAPGGAWRGWQRLSLRQGRSA